MMSFGKISAWLFVGAMCCWLGSIVLMMLFGMYQKIHSNASKNRHIIGQQSYQTQHIEHIDLFVDSRVMKKKCQVVDTADKDNFIVRASALSQRNIERLIYALSHVYHGTNNNSEDEILLVFAGEIDDQTRGILGEELMPVILQKCTQMKQRLEKLRKKTDGQSWQSKN